MQPPLDVARPARRAWADALWPTVLFLATVAYLVALPRNLSHADESVYLYEAKRVLQGAVPYRDFFEIITPGWMYLMAALFGLFGTDLATARVAMAVMHGAVVVLVFRTCRRLGVRTALAWPPALAYLVVCQSAWPIASQHWLGTLLAAVLLLSCAGFRAPPRAALWPGVVVGLLVAVHQQRGAAMGLGIALWLVSDHLLQRRFDGGPPWRSLLARCTWVAAGVAIVIVPTLGIAVLRAGLEPVWRALVIHPLFNYRAVTRCSWGYVEPFLSASLAAYTFPRLLKYLPVVLPVAAARLGRGWLRRRDLAAVRRLNLLIVFCLASMLSITYFPDYIHIAFIAPPFFVAVAESVEWAAGMLPASRRAGRWVGAIAAAAFLAACGAWLHRNFVRSWHAYPYERDTAFGRVHFAREIEAQLYERVRDVMRDVPGREVFCYPVISSLYLLADVDNPTRFQFFLPGYNSPDQVREVVDTLRARRLPYVVALTGFRPPDDPVLVYLREEYEPLDGPAGGAIFRRKATAGTAPAAAGDAGVPDPSPRAGADASDHP